MPQTFLERVDHYIEGLTHVNPGVAYVCDTCCRDWGMDWTELRGAQESAEGITDEGGFSRRQCDTCGSTLGGNRYSGHGFDQKGNIVHLSMCEDCLCYFANGDIPQGEDA